MAYSMPVGLLNICNVKNVQKRFECRFNRIGGHSKIECIAYEIGG